MTTITLRKSSERGFADHGWLVSRHTFSFGEYYDPAHMGFRSLRVLNEDRVAPGGGFPTHPHRDMEIFSYVVKGTLEHKDSLGNGRQLKPGQVQLMSAGRGVTHSEFNPSGSEELHFLQIWIKPRATGLAPGYTEWLPSPEMDSIAKVLIISPDGREGSATIAQDVDVYRIRLTTGRECSHTLSTGRAIWLQVISGALSTEGAALGPGDAMSAEEVGTIKWSATEESEALLFDLP